MSRRQIQPQSMSDDTLREVVLDYQEAKEQEKSVKKVVSNLGDTIKTEMQNRDLTEFIVDDVVASISVTPKQEVNELQAIEILRKKFLRYCTILYLAFLLFLQRFVKFQYL